MSLCMYCSYQVWHASEAKQGGETHRHKDLRSVSGMELVMEELVEVIVLMDGLIPYAG